MATQELLVSECASCDSLWREYRNSMIAHLEAVDELTLAEFSGNIRRIPRLERVVSFAEQLREEGRNAAILHEDEHRMLMAA